MNLTIRLSSLKRFACGCFPFAYLCYNTLKKKSNTLRQGDATILIFLVDLLVLLLFAVNITVLFCEFYAYFLKMFLCSASPPSAKRLFCGMLEGFLCLFSIAN